MVRDFPLITGDMLHRYFFPLIDGRFGWAGNRYIFELCQVSQYLYSCYTTDGAIPILYLYQQRKGFHAVPTT